MKYLFLILCLTIISYQLFAEEELPSESSSIFYGEIVLTVPPSFYTDSWNPKEKLPLKLSGILVEEKDLIVDLDKAIKKSREEQDLLRSQNSWLSENTPWVPSIVSKAELYEEVETNEMHE